jgi:hypothetical protein
MPIPVPVVVELSDGERAQLESWARRHTSAQALALRSQIVLLADEGLNNTHIAERLGIAVASARKWRNSIAWTGCLTNRGLGARGRSLTSRSRR